MTYRTVKRLLPALACFAIIPLTLGGCPPAGPSGPPLTPVSKEERFAAFNQVDQLLAPLELTGDPAQSEQIAGLLRTMPEFTAVVVEDNVITAQFKDGALYMIANNRPGSDTPGAPPRNRVFDIPSDLSGGPAARAIKADDDRRAQGIPGTSNRIPESKTAVLINAMGTAYCDIRPTIGGWLSNAGYSVTMVDGTVENLRDAVKGAGVVYYNGHGAPCPPELFPGADGAPTAGKRRFALWTKTQVTDQNYGNYLAEYAAKEMCFFRCETDKLSGSDDCEDWTGKKTKSELHFLITDAFIQKHWRCSEGSLVYIDACHGAEDTSVLPEVCLKTEVNASAYVGWNAMTLDRYSTPTAYFFFDRLLGANSYEPIRSPPQRPLSTSKVLTAMKGVVRRSLPMDTSESAKNLYRSAAEPPAPVEAPFYARLIALYADDTFDVLLRPAIESMSVAESTPAKLRINGTFPETPCTVTVGGESAAVQTQTGALIEATISSSASGQVKVASLDRESPPRRLTQWNLNLRRLFMDFPTQQSTNCPSCFWEGNLQYSFRGDTAGVRVVPEGPVSPPSFTGGASSGNITVTNAGGTYPIGQGTSITLVPNPDDGAAFIGTCVGFLPTADNNYLGACFFLQGSENRILFSPTLSALGVIRNYHGGVYDGEVHPMQVLYSGNQAGNELELQLSPNFNIAAGQKMTGPNSYFEWDAAVATSPAEATDAR